jgi:hypothetical protein
VFEANMSQWLPALGTTVAKGGAGELSPFCLEFVMRRVGLLLVAFASLSAAPASAAQFIVNFDTKANVPNNNDFRSQLSARGLRSYTNAGATLALSAPGTITFERVGSESGFTNRFTGGSVTALESDGNRFGSPVLLGAQVFAQGSLQGKLFFTTNGNGNVSQIGTDGFGIFLPRNAVGQYRSNTIFLGFDDVVTNDDNDHDDFIVRATVVGGVPEPTTWAMLIAGFGLVGFAARRSPARAAA